MAFLIAIGGMGSGKAQNTPETVPDQKVMHSCGCKTKGSPYLLETVPNPKATPSWNYVSDPDRIIGQSHEETINQTLRGLEEATGIQMVVVALQSIGDVPAQEFATDLGNYWGVGQRQADNGVVLLLVMDQKRWQVATGYLIETLFPDAACVRLGEETLVPRFRKGAFGQGLEDYAQEFAHLMQDSTGRAQYLEALVDYKDHSLDLGSVWVYFQWYLGISGFLALTAVVLSALAYLSPDPYKAYRQVYPLGYPLWAVLFVVPYLGVLPLIRWMLRRLRNRPRRSKSTGNLLVKLSEKEDDQALKKGNRVEENINSIDYDVWVDPSNPEDKLILPYPKRSSKHFRCNGCGYRTGYTIDEIVRIATTLNDGMGRKTTLCKHCRHKRVSGYIIPKRYSSSGSGGGGSSFGGGSSGGSSFGGGSFGGGGGGGSW